MSKRSRTDLCGGWPERAIPTATGGETAPSIADVRIRIGSEITVAVMVAEIARFWPALGKAKLWRVRLRQ